MTRRINYKKSRETGWVFSSKIIKGILPYVYYMSTGRYTSDPQNSEGEVVSRIDIYDNHFIKGRHVDSFYCREDVEDYVEDDKLYFVSEIKEYWVETHIYDKQTILSILPTREESLSLFTKTFELDEEDQKVFNELLKECDNDLSYTCYRFCDEVLYCLEENCITIIQVPPISFVD